MTVGLQTRVGEHPGSLTAGSHRFLVCVADSAAEREFAEVLGDSRAQVVSDRDSYLAASSSETFDAILVEYGGENGTETWRDAIVDERSAESGVIVVLDDPDSSRRAKRSTAGPSALSPSRSASSRLPRRWP